MKVFGWELLICGLKIKFNLIKINMIVIKLLKEVDRWENISYKDWF